MLDDIDGIFLTRITPLALIGFATSWASLIRFMMGLVNIGRIDSAWEIHLRNCICAEAVPIPRLKTIHRMKHPSLGDQTPP